MLLDKFKPFINTRKTRRTEPSASLAHYGRLVINTSAMVLLDKEFGENWQYATIYHDGKSIALEIHENPVKTSRKVHRRDGIGTVFISGIREAIGITDKVTAFFNVRVDGVGDGRYAIFSRKES